MKSNNLSSVLAAAALSFLMAFGGIRCLSTGFEIELSLSVLVLHCSIWALAGSFLFSRPRGGWIVLLALGLLGIWLWRKSQLIDQILQLCYQITRLYAAAYRMGWLGRPTDVDSVALPLYLWAGLNALLSSWCLTRRKCTAAAVITSLLPLALCLVLTNTIPRLDGLFCLLLGLILTLLTRNTGRDQTARLTWLLSGPVAIALILLFLTNPQATYNKQHYGDAMGDALLRAVDRIPYVDFDDDGALRFSFTQHIPSFVDLQNKGPNRQFSIPVMEVTAQTGGYLYLRGRDYDIYTGTQWDASPDRDELFTSIQDNHNHGNSYLGELTIKTSGSLSSRYLPYYPETHYLLQGGACNNLGNANVYSYNWYALPEHYYSPAHNWKDPDSGLSVPGTFAGYLQLPEDTKAWAESYLASRLTLIPEDATVDTVANAIADLVRESAGYDLDTPQMPTETRDFARWFLEESDSGYCVHFATATTVLLRAAGIHARYVEGYLTETLPGRPVTVTEKDAHAWAEYYVLGIGWIPLESTAALQLSEPVPSLTTEQTTSPTEESTTAPTATEGTTAPDDHTTAPNQITTGPANTTPDNPPVTPQTPTSQPAKKLALTAVKPVLAILGILLLLLAQYRIRLQLQEKTLQSGTPNSRALKNWQYTCRLCRLLNQAPPEQLQTLALRAKFSQHTLTAEELACFDSFRRDAVDRLRRRNWWLRLYHRLIWAAY